MSGSDAIGRNSDTGHGITRFARLAFLSCLMSSSQAALAQQSAKDAGQICLPVMIPSTLVDQSHGDSDSAFRDAFCGKWNEEHNSDAGGTLGIDVVGEGSLDAAGHSTSKNVSASQFCSDKSAKASARAESDHSGS